jgi:sugar lactone lactonase YvrE
MAFAPRRRLVAASTVTAGVALVSFLLWSQLRRTAVSPPDNEEWVSVAGVIAGDGVTGVRDGHSGRARFSDPFGIASGPEGTLFVADGVDAHRIRRIGPDGSVSTIAGSTRGFQDGPADVARFDTPSGVTVATDGSLYVADTANNAVRHISPDGRVSTIAGRTVAGFADGLGVGVAFNGPLAVAMSPTGSVVIADTYNDRIREMTPDGRVTTLAGSGRFGLLDGAAAEARFDTPVGVAVDSLGVVYVADAGNNTVRRISPDGWVTTIAPLPDGGLFRPTGITVDQSGTLYVADEGGRIIEIQPGVRARVLAGSGPGFANGSGATARFRAPTGLAMLGERRLAVADRRNALVRVIERKARRATLLPDSPLVSPRFDFDQFAQTPLLWPVHPQDGPFEITGTMGEVRGGDGQERFHAGLDVRAREGTTVRAVRDGVVSDPIATSEFDTLNESVRIGPIVYVHQRVGRVRSAVYRDMRLAPLYDDSGVLARVRVKRGSRYEVGEAIGTTNRFNHVHINVGWPREEINPLRSRLVQFLDTVQPTIVRGGIHVIDAAGIELKARRRGRLVVSGRVRVVVDAWDQVDGNRPERRLGLYRLGYQVIAAAGGPAPGFEQMRETLRFEQLFPDENAARLAYAPGSGIPFFGGRRTRFLYEVTNEVHNGRAAAGVWDTSLLAPGDYVLRILATDVSGNVAIGNRDVAVAVVP